MTTQRQARNGEKGVGPNGRKGKPMLNQNASPKTLLKITAVAGVVAVIFSLIYLAAEPGKMPASEILATVFGVGLTVFIAGGLAALMFFSSRSGRDDEVGHGSPPEP
jgi:uncharacterized membrane protein HdeD (DUF308 family)